MICQKITKPWVSLLISKPWVSLPILLFPFAYSLFMGVFAYSLCLFIFMGVFAYSCSFSWVSLLILAYSHFHRLGPCGGWGSSSTRLSRGREQETENGRRLVATLLEQTSPAPPDSPSTNKNDPLRLSLLAFLDPTPWYCPKRDFSVHSTHTPMIALQDRSGLVRPEVLFIPKSPADQIMPPAIDSDHGNSRTTASLQNGTLKIGTFDAGIVGLSTDQ